MILRARVFQIFLVLFMAGFPILRPTDLQGQVQPVQGGVQLNFQAVDLAFVFSALAQAANINVVYHDLPAKAITMRTVAPVPVAEIPELIRSLARANGVGVAQESGFLRLQGAGATQQSDLRELYTYTLRHARASALSATLQALFGGAIPTGGGGGGTTATTLSQQLNQLQQAGVAQAVAPPNIILQQPGSGELQGNVLIVPDEVTNMLIIRATPSDWNIVQAAIQSLDLRPLQVVIEVVIAEVRRTNEMDIGTAFAITRTEGNETRSAEIERTPPAGGISLSFLRTGSVDVDATLSAMASSGNVRILSRPVIQAQNNQEARILVGSQRPFVQSSFLGGTVGGQTQQIVQYRNVGTELTILPMINEEGYVNLSVVQVISNATSETQFDAPVISTREATTQILARNGQTVVIGGLVDEQEDRTKAGIPLLKDIPLLGRLFGYQRTSQGTAELFLFLTPYIVATDLDADLFRQRIEETRPTGQILPEETITPPVSSTIIIMEAPDASGGLLIVPAEAPAQEGATP